MEDYVFRAEKLCVGYRKKPLIQEITIGLKRGEILTLIGPNGAGKSTILKSIAGQLELIGGTICLNARDIKRMSRQELSRKMAVVLTDKIRAQMMSCEDIVATGRYPYTGHMGILAERDHRAVEEAMQFVHVDTIRERDFLEISDGQRQRVMLARALCQEPEIILLDEPTSYLDIKYKLEFLSLLQKMREKRGLTVILSLHELDLAQRISDHLLCVKGEYVDRYGTPSEIFQADYIRRLFDIETGSYDEESCCPELAKPIGELQYFVIAGNGRGRSVYRELQRAGQAFATGILYTNDLDYPVARALAQDVVCAEAFEPVGADAFAVARQKIDACQQVICCREEFGSLEQFNRQLLDYAISHGKLKK